jgi:hypothetical protein
VWRKAREWLRRELSPLGFTPVPDTAGNNWPEEHFEKAISDHRHDRDSRIQR